MNKKQAHKVTEYLLNWIEFFDGKGLTITDFNRIKKELSTIEQTGYGALSDIFKEDENDKNKG